MEEEYEEEYDLEKELDIADREYQHNLDKIWGLI